MRIAISNLAWGVDQDQQIAELLHAYGVFAIDVVPGKYFSNIARACASEVVAVRRWWNDRGIEITGMQSLLYGSFGLNIFGEADVQQAMLSHLEEVCRIGRILGATRLVFGSPRNRDRSALSDEATQTVADAFFRRLGDIAAGYGVLICLEPNPSCYGANFMTNGTETAEVVRSVAHPAIRMQFDTGALTINGENPAETLQQCAELVGHIHLSEPGLLPLGDSDTDHAAIAEALARHLPGHVATIEMMATGGEAHEISIARAVETALHYYSRLA
ncbi:MAG: sugar phosphate isomerase/epimerase family protein [Acidobacteriaceae bacterium]